MADLNATNTLMKNQTKPISVRVTPDTHAKLKAKAKSQGRALANLCSLILTDAAGGGK